MERGRFYGADSADAENQERAALQAALDAELYPRATRPVPALPAYGFPVQNSRPVHYQEPRHITSHNFAFNSVSHNVMGVTRFMSPRHQFPGMPIFTPPTPPPAAAAPAPSMPPQGSRLAQWQSVHRLLQDLEQARARPENRFHGAGFGGDAIFAGRHAPSSSIHTTGPPQHGGIFQRRMMREDLHSQAEAVVQAMTRAEASRPYGEPDLPAFLVNRGLMTNQLGHGGLQLPIQHFHQPGSDNEENFMMGNSRQPPPPRSVFGVPHLTTTFSPPYQDTAKYDEIQRFSDTEDFWQEHHTTQLTSSHNYESAGYDIPQMIEPPGSAYNAASSSNQQQNIYHPHTGAFADSGQEVHSLSSKLLAPNLFRTHWTPTSEELNTQQGPSLYQPETVATDDDEELLNKKIQEVAEFMTRLTSFDDDETEEPDDIAAEPEHTEPPTEINNEPYNWFRSGTRGRRNNIAHQIEKSFRSKKVSFMIETTQFDTAEETTGIKETTQTDGAKVTIPDAEKIDITEKDAGDKGDVEPGSSGNQEQAAQDTEQTGTRAQPTPQKKQKGKFAKKHD